MIEGLSTVIAEVPMPDPPHHTGYLADSHPSFVAHKIISCAMWYTSLHVLDLPTVANVRVCSRT